MGRKFPSRAELEQRVVIGVDECNSGYERPVPLIVVAHVAFPRMNSNGDFGKKHGFCADATLRAWWRPRALGYLAEHQPFRYCVIPREPEVRSYAEQRMWAAARLICETVPVGALGAGEDPVVIIDGQPFGCFTPRELGRALDEMGVHARVFFRRKADVNYGPVRVADRVAYCLAGLRFGNPAGRWPYRQSMVRMDPPVWPSAPEEDLEERLLRKTA